MAGLEPDSVAPHTRRGSPPRADPLSQGVIVRVADSSNRPPGVAGNGVCSLVRAKTCASVRARVGRVSDRPLRRACRSLVMVVVTLAKRCRTQKCALSARICVRKGGLGSVA